MSHSLVEEDVWVFVAVSGPHEVSHATLTVAPDGDLLMGTAIQTHTQTERESVCVKCM